MKQWYKSNALKGILIVIEHFLAVVMAVSLVWVCIYPALISDLFSGEKVKSYEDSVAFGERVSSTSASLLQGLAQREVFETDGKYDPNRIVDIKEYHDSATVTNKNVNGLAYTLGDLKDWEVSDDTESGDTTAGDIIVCEKTDGTYFYCTYKQFKELIDSGEIRFDIQAENTGKLEEDIRKEELEMLQNGQAYEGDYKEYIKGIQDAEGNPLYVRCWNYDGYYIAGDYKPVGADSLLDIVNQNPDWNGKLNEIYEMLSSTTYRIYGQWQSYRYSLEELTEGDTNLAYLYVDNEAKKVYTNREKYEDYGKVEENLKKISDMGRYLVVRPKLEDFKTNMKEANPSDWRSSVKELGTTDTDFIYAVGIDTSYPIQDQFYTQNRSYEKYGIQGRKVAVAGLVSAVLFVVILVWLTIAAGRNNKDEELHLNRFDRWKTELAAAVVIGVWALIFIPIFAGSSGVMQSGIDVSFAQPYAQDGHSYNNVQNMIIGGAAAAYTCGMFLIGYLSLVRRIKAKILWKNSILHAILSFFKQLFCNLHLVWKVVLVSAGFIILQWIGVISYYGPGFMLILVSEAVAFYYLVQRAIGMQKIKKGIEQIAAGVVDYKIPLRGLKGDQLRIAERVNVIGEGLDAAVEESMKSERLKTDLITNVSHDIKTPLTSIINYIDLLKKENFTDPKILRYLEVLEAKAQRLKTLTEDVVEASKVSSGNITLEYMNINLVEMIQQTSGEFAEKFQARNLKEVLDIPEGEAIIWADGRRMWRVLENIYNNAAKYAMGGTRIYADLKMDDATVAFSLKNISEQPLNIKAEELTERFIRGDISRSTEGSGLGLSIAKSLTTMQGGTFDLYLDGDLFKVTITFPKGKKSNKGQGKVN